MEEKRPPGLRFDANGRPMWRASKGAVKAGYPVKVVNLSIYANDPRLLQDRCIKLQKEMEEWVANGAPSPLQFDGTFASLLELYQTDPESSYTALKASSRHPYDVYIPMLKAEIGKCHIDRTDGRDVKKWFAFWSLPAAKREKPKIAKARMLISILKAAVRFGVICRLPGCSDFKEILSSCQFETLRPRTQVLTADQVVAARKAAHAAGHPGAALCYAIQFEGTIRQWDIKGQWVDLSDPRPSAVLDSGKKWIGITWNHLDQNLVLRFTPAKTEDTTGEDVVIDFRTCPMIMEELDHASEKDRAGPIIKNSITGLPYRDTAFNELWSHVRKAIGLSADVWNRDLRASGTTEARAANATHDDLKKLMGHSPRSETSSKVYDRAKLEAQRRIAQARKTHRERE